MDPMKKNHVWRLENLKKYQQHLEQLPQVKSLKMTVFLMEHFLQGVQFRWQMQFPKSQCIWNLLNNIRGLSKHAAYMSQSENLMILSNGDW